MSMTMWIGFSPPPTVTLAQPARNKAAPIKRVLRKSMSFPLKNLLHAKSNRQRLVNRADVKFQVISARLLDAPAPSQLDVGAQAIVAVSEVRAKRLELKIRQRFGQVFAQLGIGSPRGKARIGRGDRVRKRLGVDN